MKRVLLVYMTMNFGGAERACLNMIKKIHKDVKIDVLLLSKEGALLEELESYCSVYEANSRYKLLITPWQKAKKMGYKMRLGKIMSHILEKVSLQKLTEKWALNREKTYKYDTCICFFQAAPVMDIALKKVEADKKILFIHSALDLVDKSKSNIERIKKFDKIICVSRSCKEEFEEYLKTGDKIDFIPNIQNTEEIVEKSKEFIERFGEV